MNRTGKGYLSNDQIKTIYYGMERPLSQVVQRGVSSNRGELTPSAKYVASEAKKRIGEKVALERPAALGEDELFRLVQHIEEAEGEELSERERTSVVAALCASLAHYDILSPLVEDPKINDIIIRAYNDISIQVGRRNIQTDLHFADRESYVSFVENMLKRAGKSCTMATPVVDAAIDPHVRACVTHESFSPPGSGPMLTLRIARHLSVSLDYLVCSELAPRPILDYLAALARSGQVTMLIAGEVGTGKTTLVKALASQIDVDEAILIIEDTHEIVLDRRFTRTLLTREANTEGVGRISPAQAIRTGMRMAMNRIILGEMRDAETAESFVDVCASGHAGMSTIHARSARDAVSRLELFLSRAQGNVGIDTVRRQIANAISVVVYLGLDARHQKRRVVSILEVGASTDGVVQLSPMYSYSPQGEFPEWLRESGITFFPDLLRAQGVFLPDSGTRVGLSSESLYRAINE